MPSQVLNSGEEIKLQRNALSVLEYGPEDAQVGLDVCTYINARTAGSFGGLAAVMQGAPLNRAGNRRTQTLTRRRTRATRCRLVRRMLQPGCVSAPAEG